MVLKKLHSAEFMGLNRSYSQKMSLEQTPFDIYRLYKVLWASQMIPPPFAVSYAGIVPSPKDMPNATLDSKVKKFIIIHQISVDEEAQVFS